MRLGGIVQASVEILDDISARNRPVSDALKDWGLSHRFAGSGDRSAIGNLVYDTLRKRASQAWKMDDDGSQAAVFATLTGQWAMSTDEIRSAFEGDRFAPDMPLEQMATTMKSRDLADAPGQVRADIPQLCAPMFETAFGAQWIDEGAALSQRPPLDLRVNTLKAGREKILRQLSRFAAVPCTIATAGIRIGPGRRGERLPNVQIESGYQKGWFEIQDEGSQVAASLTGVKPGEQVLDYCAGGGGKTLAMSAMMENRGQIHAHDADRNRLAPIHERLKRAGVRNAQVRSPGDPLADLEGRMDCVLVDAPCTGSGTWRRRPDAKWRLSERNIAQRCADQHSALKEAARFVRPGGRLVYVTCSLLVQENTGQIDRFLAENADFSCSSGYAVLQHLCNSAHIPRDGLAMVLLTPAMTRTDGFFVAQMEKSRI